MLGIIRSLLVKERETDLRGGSGNSIQPDDLQTATCALLLEMAHADNEFSPAEKKRIFETLQVQFCLSNDAAGELVELADKKRRESIDLWQFAKTIKSHYSLEKRMELMELIWRVVYADDSLDKHEDYLVHKLATLLGLSHERLVDAKMKVLEENRGRNS